MRLLKHPSVGRRGRRSDLILLCVAESWEMREVPSQGDLSRSLH